MAFSNLRGFQVLVVFSLNSFKSQWAAKNEKNIRMNNMSCMSFHDLSQRQRERLKSAFLSSLHQDYFYLHFFPDFNPMFQILLFPKKHRKKWQIKIEQFQRARASNVA